MMTKCHNSGYRHFRRRKCKKKSYFIINFGLHQGANITYFILYFISCWMWVRRLFWCFLNIFNTTKDKSLQNVPKTMKTNQKRLGKKQRTSDRTVNRKELLCWVRVRTNHVMQRINKKFQKYEKLKHIVHKYFYNVFYM